jgi:hypothetical protein
LGRGNLRLTGELLLSEAFVAITPLTKNIFKLIVISFVKTSTGVNAVKLFTTVINSVSQEASAFVALNVSWGQCYKTFYGRKLRLFKIS